MSDAVLLGSYDVGANNILHSRTIRSYLTVELDNFCQAIAAIGDAGSTIDWQGVMVPITGIHCTLLHNQLDVWANIGCDYVVPHFIKTQLPTAAFALTCQGDSHCDSNGVYSVKITKIIGWKEHPAIASTTMLSRPFTTIS